MFSTQYVLMQHMKMINS